MYKFVAIRRQGMSDESLFEISFELPNSAIKQENGEWVIDLSYGYSHTTEERTEGRFSATPGRKYIFHKQVLPKRGDYIEHPKSHRSFQVGEVEGFLNYRAPIYENGVTKVGYIKFEDYYKD